jgi:uncharacterized protein YndB with AHSA1/START domain
MQLLDRGIMRRTVESCVNIAASPAVCWPFLNDPLLRAEWFADTFPLDTNDGATVDLKFGDGDFFRVTTVDVEEPASLSWTWRFMGIGASSDIEFRLTGHDGGTRVTVRDLGEYSESGVSELEEGWADFLSRLRKRIETGANSRYQWNQSIGASVVVGANPGTLLRTLGDHALWATYFPETEVHIKETADGVRLEFRRSEYGGVPTIARLSLSGGDSGFHLSVSHEGWLQLSQDCRIAERRRAAENWARLLAHLESSLAR